jgi:drug/metabolite transporter (DMT)-like permease
MTSEHARLRLKSWICALVVIFSNVSGNFFLKSGMPAQLEAPLDYITVLLRPAVALGVVLLILWMVSRMALLSWADLSYVLPVTSVGYVLVALAGRVLLHEQITARRWTGIGLIMTGVALVSGGTAPQTVSRHSKANPGAAGAAR